MRAAIEPGTKFGRLTVVRQIGSDGVRRQYECLCACGSTITSTSRTMRRMRHPSCGCWGRELGVSTINRHLGRKTPEYAVWSGIKARCYRKSHISYPYYGGRGIRMHDPWRRDFAQFIADMGPRPTDQHSIDRLDVDGDYEPGNCRWATNIEQGNNRRGNRNVEYQGVTMTVAEAARMSGIHYKCLLSRATRGNRGDDLFRPSRHGVAP